MPSGYDVDSGSSPTPELLSIGQLAERTCVAPTALRYYDELGLVRPQVRESGQRRYAESAVTDVGVVVFLREVGFTLAEIGALVSGNEDHAWRSTIERKLVELEERQRRLEVALAALSHARRCPAGNPGKCPRFRAILDGRRGGLSLEESHARVHAGPERAETV